MSSSILIFGKSGQVATELAVAPWKPGAKLHFLGRGDLDLERATQDEIAGIIRRIGPSLAINAAAYTAVDKAETEPDIAFALNAAAPGLIAQSCAQAEIPLIHISTDYVFDGAKNAPYVETDPVNPISIYGASKEAGEQAVREAGPRHIILRTAWVYSPHGQNFVKTMLRLGAARQELDIVDDQIGSPTSAADIAQTIAQIAHNLPTQGPPNFGTYHFCAAGHTSWYGFASAIFDEARMRARQAPEQINPIPTSAYPTLAKRPQNSRLSCAKLSTNFGVTPQSWRKSLDVCLNVVFGPTKP